MTDQTAATKSTRRIQWLMAVVLGSVVLYALGWHLAGRKLVSIVTDQLTAIEATGQQAQCEAPEAKGFPFRIGLFCRAVAWGDAERQVKLSAGALRTTAVVYRPSLVIAELDGPALIDVPGLVPLALGWTSARASVRVDKPLPQRLSVVLDSVTVDERLAGEERSALSTIAGIEAHMRQRDAEAVDLAMTVTGFETAGLPPIDLEADASWNDPQSFAAWLDSGNPAALRGRGGEIRTLAFAPQSGGRLSVSGPLALGEDGLLNGELTVTIVEGAKLTATIREAGRALGLPLDQVATMLENAMLLGDGAPIIISIRNGQAMAGFIPLGFIPPI